MSFLRGKMARRQVRWHLSEEVLKGPNHTHPLTPQEPLRGQACSTVGETVSI